MVTHLASLISLLLMERHCEASIVNLNLAKFVSQEFLSGRRRLSNIWALILCDSAEARMWRERAGMCRFEITMDPKFIGMSLIKLGDWFSSFELDAFVYTWIPKGQANTRVVVKPTNESPSTARAIVDWPWYNACTCNERNQQHESRLCSMMIATRFQMILHVTKSGSNSFNIFNEFFFVDVFLKFKTMNERIGDSNSITLHWVVVGNTHQPKVLNQDIQINFNRFDSANEIVRHLMTIKAIAANYMYIERDSPVNKHGPEFAWAQVSRQRSYHKI